jgi:ribonuclease-3
MRTPRRSAPSATRPSTSTSTAPSDPGGLLATAARLAERLGLPIRDLDLLAEALVHSSYPNDHPGSTRASNERLEFLGDAVVALVVSETLYRRHPDEDEGVLSNRRAAIVSNAGLAALARRAGLGDHLLLGAGADLANERERPSLLADAFEAVAGAIFLDGGLDAVRRWLLAIAAPELDAPPASPRATPAKSRLQEIAQARGGAVPAYRIVSAEGPDHHKHYVVEVLLEGRVLGRGEGRNRRAAETAAAAAALAALGAGEPAAGAEDGP